MNTISLRSHGLGDVLQEPLRLVVDAWATLRAARERRLERDAAAELDDDTLRDIGAPDWLLAEAESRREARAAEQLALRFARPGW